MLPNNKVEEQTAEEIKSNVTSAIIEYFGLKPDELNELVINRIDVHCDYQFDDKEEIDIIINILEKAPQNYYTYKKHILKNDKDGYILKYYSTKKNKSIIEPISFETGYIAIEKKGEENEKTKS